MVDLAGGKGGMQHSFDNTVFIIPLLAVLLIVGGAGYKLYNSLKQKELKKLEKKAKKEAKKTR